MQVRWYEQTEQDVRPDESWLSEWELGHLRTLKVPKRRGDWLLGRWTAKRAAADYLALPTDPADLSTIEIRPDETGAPEVFVRGAPADLAISLTHRNGLGACVLGGRGKKFGCDLEAVEPRSDAFVEDYFTFEEQSLLAGASAADRFTVAALIWSAKESALKALRVGLRSSTRSVSVECVSAVARSQVGFSIDVHSLNAPPAEKWGELLLKCSPDLAFEGKWCRTGEFVRTVVVAND